MWIFSWKLRAIFIEQHNAKTYICRAFWRVFVQAHSIELGDIVHFDPVAWGNLFNVEVFDEGGIKRWMITILV